MYTKKARKKKELDWPITIFYDDREKKGIWHIDHPKFRFVKKRLKTADYTIKGFMDRVAIERKAGWHEVVHNLKGKKRYAFEAYLEKLAKFEVPVFVIEDNLSNIPKVLRGLKYTSLKNENIYHWVNKICMQLGIHLVCVDFSKVSKDEFLYYMFENILERITNEK